MRPSLSASDAAHSRLTDSVGGGDIYLLARIAADRLNLLLRELGETVPLSSLTRSMAMFVGIVSLRGIPSKVAGVAIHAVAVIVGALQPMWARPQKRLSNQGVNVRTERHSIGAQIDGLVSTLLPDVRGEQSSDDRARSAAPSVALAGFASHAPQIADRKQPLKTNDGAPLFMNIFHVIEYALASNQSQHAFTLKGGF